MSECNSHVWSGCICQKCGADIFDINANLRAKLETAEQERNDYKTIVEQAKKHTAIWNDRAIENLNECQALEKERDSLSAKIGELESQVAVIRGVLEKITKQNSAQTMERIARKALSVAPVESSYKLQELERYAELSRLAIKEFDTYECKGIITDNCKPHDDFTIVCDNYWFCRLRAELMAEVQEDA